MSLYDLPQAPRNLLAKVSSALASRRPPEQPVTAQGVSPEVIDMGGLFNGHIDLPQDRQAIYADMEEIDNLMPEGSRALDILADNAVNAPEGTYRSFRVRFDEGRSVSQAKQALILNMLERTRLQEKVYGMAREALKYGDNFQQVVVNDSLHIEKLIYMDPTSMVRNEDILGQLVSDNTAFQQVIPSSNYVLASFYPWQIEHIRWGRSGGSKYGRPLLYTARYPFRKLTSMEEALVVNWLTRAFARLLFELDATGKSPKEAQEMVNKFMAALKNRTGTSMERLTVARDIAIAQTRQNYGGKWEPSLNKVSVLDTSNTGFWNVEAVKYWRDKFITATGVPKAHLGLEQDINARATLQWQDERFAHTIRRVQMMMSETITHLIQMELALSGIDYRQVDFVIEWPTPSILDAQAHAQTMLAYAQAFAIFKVNGALDPEFAATNWVKLTPSQWARVEHYFSTEGAHGDTGSNGSQGE